MSEIKLKRLVHSFVLRQDGFELSGFYFRYKSKFFIINEKFITINVSNYDFERIEKKSIPAKGYTLI